MADALKLPRMSGDPVVIAGEIRTRALCGYVYVGSYVRHKQIRRTLK